MKVNMKESIETIQEMKAKKKYKYWYDSVRRGDNRLLNTI